MSARNIRLYLPLFEAANVGGVFNLYDDTHHYLTRVLRIRVGEMLRVFHESQGEWLAKVVHINKSSTDLLILEKLRNADTAPELTFAIPLIRPQYFEMMLAMGTQCGVTNFVPILFEFSQKHEVKTERALRILIENTEQSERIGVPKLSTLRTFEEFVQAHHENFMVAVEPKHAQTNYVLPHSFQSITLMIGPEGGYSSHEINYLKDQKIPTFSIPGPVMRVETSVPAVIGYLKGRSLGT